MNKGKTNTLVPFLAIIAGVLIGCILLILTGKNPIILFQELLKGLIGIDLARGKFFQLRYIGELLVASMPLILTGLAIAFAYRTGLFNIGAEGQVIMGSLFTIFVATQVELPSIIHIPLALAAGALGGALWALIPGVLKAYYNIVEVVVGIMLNYVALYISNYFIFNMEGYRNMISPKVLESASLRVPWISQLFGGSRMHLGIFVVILAVIAYWFIIEKTTYGYNLRATGYNKDGAEYAGLKVNRNIVSSMMISGAFAGLAGSLLTLGTFGHAKTMTSFGNVGYDGIAVALVGNLSGIGVAFAGILFGLLGATKPMLQMRGIPEEIGGIIAALIVFFVASQKLLTMLINIYNKRKEEKLLTVSIEGGDQ
ncbi:MAG TPA: ABC transporter permease [Erysipelotrichaceae bacterium]|nr:ABC transporter permease [Erysipelotrichaceae bacterium]